MKLKLIALAIMAFALISRVNTARAADTPQNSTSTTAITTPAPQVQALAPNALMFTSELRTTLKDGHDAMMVFWSSEQFADEAHVVDYLNKVQDIHCRLATDAENEAISAKFGKDQVYAAATKLGIGHGDAHHYTLERNVAAIVITDTAIVPHTAGATTSPHAASSS